MTGKPERNMLDLPTWLRLAVPDLHCPHCDKAMQREYILSIGIRQSQRNENSVLFFEYECDDCKQRSIVELNPMTLGEFIDCMSPEVDSAPTERDPLEDDPPRPKRKAKAKRSTEPPKKEKKVQKKRNKPSASKITDAEVHAMTRKIYEADDNLSFLRSIGMAEADIQKYAIYKGRRRKKPKPEKD